MFSAHTSHVKILCILPLRELITNSFACLQFHTSETRTDNATVSESQIARIKVQQYPDLRTNPKVSNPHG